MNIDLEKAYKKKFNIGGSSFLLKKNLNLDESEEAGKLHTMFFNPNKLEVTSIVSGNDVKRFLSIVLEREDKKAIDDNFNFGLIDEDELTKVFLFFFISRVKKGIDGAKDSANLINELIQQ